MGEIGLRTSQNTGYFAFHRNTIQVAFMLFQSFNRIKAKQKDVIQGHNWKAQHTLQNVTSMLFPAFISSTAITTITITVTITIIFMQLQWT
jgi:hypothetical protein